MDMMEIRRRVLMGSRKKVIDTSPKIVEYGKACAYATTGEHTDKNMCYTEWYLFDTGTVGPVYLSYFYFSTTATRLVNYQFYQTKADGTIARGWFYNISEDTHRRSIGSKNIPLTAIRFTVPIADIDDAYAYINETGQIFFAGKNSPYYGYTNINDMPQ